MVKYLSVGEILKPQGVRGEVKVRPLTNDITRFEDLEDAFFEENGVYTPIKTQLVRLDEDAAYLKIEGVEDRNAAEELRGKLIYVDREHAVELGEDEDFIVDLIGLKGIDDEGNEWGVITDVMQPGGNDVYVFTDRKNRRETLVPALKSVVIETNYEEGYMKLSAKRLGEVAVTDDI